MGLSGVVLDGLPYDTVTDADGNYRVTVALNWSGRFAPRRAGYAFVPALRRLVQRGRGPGRAGLHGFLRGSWRAARHSGLGRDIGRVRAGHVERRGRRGELQRLSRRDGRPLCRTEAQLRAADGTELRRHHGQSSVAERRYRRLQRGGKAVTTYYRHYYWVRAVNQCSEGDFGVTDSGYRGLATAGKTFAAVALGVDPLFPADRPSSASLSSATPTEASAFPQGVGDGLVLAIGLLATWALGRRKLRPTHASVWPIRGSPC